MTPQEFNKKLDKTVKDIQNNHNGTIMASVGLIALTLLRQRVQEKGINAEGQKYKAYSTKPTLVGCKTFVQKSACAALLGSKPKRKDLEWRTINGHRLAILPGGYKQIRELQGRQTDHVDFSVTNDMWNDINVISKPTDHQKGIAIIGAKKEKEKQKLAGNTARRGDILDLSVKEQEELIGRYNLQVLKIFKENGL